MDVKGCAALVTGGSQGLGEATARALAAAGAKVAIIDVKKEQAEKVASTIGGIGLACDVSDAAQAEQAVAAARAAHGPARILVNCAGIAPAKRIVGRDGAMPLDEFRRVIEVNLIGSFNMMRLAAADMSKLDPLTDGERGLVVSTASIAAFEGQIGQAAYASSKAGVIGLMLPAAREFARSGIRVLVIAPGLFGTSLLLDMPKDIQDSLAQQVPFPSRFGKPEEYADTVLWIARNPMVNGTVIRLDGAMRMQAK
jgi:NAD(P)-dependent dehydrogenase (short-subunit alcohol dehydrogenase family)